MVGRVEEPVHGPRDLLLREEPLVVAAERGQGLGVGGGPEAEAQLVQKLGDEPRLVVVYRTSRAQRIDPVTRVTLREQASDLRECRGVTLSGFASRLVAICALFNTHEQARRRFAESMIDLENPFCSSENSVDA